MAAAAGEEPEYESDPDAALLSSAMRRREASDDEQGSDGERKPVMADRRIGYDEDSDEQGGALTCEDEEGFEQEEDEEEEEEEVKKELEEGSSNERERGSAAGEAEISADNSGGDDQRMVGENGDNRGNDQVEEEKKENEPSVVPTAGAFYMHDDRLRVNGRGRHRPTVGGRKLRESADNWAWVHDRFEEMNLQDKHNEGRRISKRPFRDRGRNHGTDHGHVRGNRSQTYDDRSRFYDDRSRGDSDKSQVYDGNNNQNHASKFVKGRELQRYLHSAKNYNESPASQNEQPGKLHGLASYGTATTQQSPQTSTVQPEPVPQEHVVASDLNSASPPFYPSGSPNQHISATSKRGAHAGIKNRSRSSSVVVDNFTPMSSNGMLRGKAVVDSHGQGNMLRTGDSVHPTVGKSLLNRQLPSSGSSLPPINKGQSPQLGVQKKGLNMTGQFDYQSASFFNKGGRDSAQKQLPAVQQRLIQTPIQPMLRASAQLMVQYSGVGPHASSPPQAPSTNSSEVRESESPPKYRKSKTPMSEKGKSSKQGSGRASLMYNGDQVIVASGAMSLGHGDQGYPGTPALLPVMQFGGQHPGGVGVPAVGMAFPGYVAQQQLGLGNAEMTWMPVLAGAAGTLGASYGPYLAVDGSYYVRQSGQASPSINSRKDANTTKSSPQRPGIVNDELEQRQNKPHRYSEMNFGQ